MATVIQHCAVLGSPISHSLSPVLHTAAYRALGLKNWSYEQCEVTSGSLQVFLSQIDSSWKGLSLTMPLKRESLSLGTAEDYWTSKLGIANTAILMEQVQESHRLLNLYNTDVEGIVCALAASSSGDGNQFEPFDMIRALESVNDVEQTIFTDIPIDGSVMVIGTGATACSAIAALHTIGATELIIAARHLERALHAQQLAKTLGFRSVTVVDMEEGGMFLAHACLVVSTIPAGAADSMARSLEEGYQTCRKQEYDPVLLDVVYGSGQTRLSSSWSRVRKGVALQGDRMLLYQAVRQVSLMTSVPIEDIPVHAMDSAMREALL